MKKTVGEIWVSPQMMKDPKNTNLLYWIELDSSKAQKITLAVSAIDVYKLYVNEKFLTFGPARAAKGFARIDSVECELCEGKNRIALLVCSYGVGTYSATRQRPFFFCDFHVDEKSYTATDFVAFLYDVRVKHTQRYSAQRAFAEYYVQSVDMKTILRSPNLHLTLLSTERITPPIRMDRQVPHPVSTLIATEVSVCFGSVVSDTCKKHPKTRYIDHPYSGFEYYTREELTECTVDYVASLVYQGEDSVTKDLCADQYLLYDFGRNLSGFWGMEITVHERAEIYYVFDEIRQEGEVLNYFRNDTCNVIKWQLEPGVYSLESMDLYGGRFVQVVLRTGRIFIERVTMRTAENPDARNLSFCCNDASVQSILCAAQNTLAQCAVDLFMDCPSRERAGWINDVFFTRRAAEALTGNTLIERATLENFAYGEALPQLPKGMIPMCYPAEHMSGRFIPNCAMWYGIIACEYCIKTADRAFAEVIEERVYDIIRYFDTFENEYGLLENLDSWVFVEWSEANSEAFVKGVNFPSNMMYQAMLEAVAELYSDVALKEKAANMKKTILDLSYNGEFFEDNLLRGEDGKLYSPRHISEACQYHAFYFGYANRMSHPALYDLLKNVFVPEREKSTTYPFIDKANIITGLMMREWIWLEEGELERAVEETKKIFAPMAATTGTLWEHTGYYASCNHGCASYAAYVLIRAYTGFYGLQKGMPVLLDCYLGEDCEMRLPLSHGTLYLSVKNGVREWRIE